MIFVSFTILLINLQNFISPIKFIIETFAISPSIVRQEIIDDENDWQQWQIKKDNSNEKSPEKQKTTKSKIPLKSKIKSDRCELPSILLPDIQSLSYMSDGEKLNVTVWLSQTFSEIVYEDIIKNNTMSEISGISSSGPSLPRVVQFVMGIDILSINNRGIDYTIELTSPLETNKPFWTQNIYEISAYGNKKIVHTQTFDTFPYNDKKFVEFSIDLKSIGYPDKYKLLFYIVDVYPLDGKYCRIVDTSNWTLIPPPSFSIFVNPNNVVMRPPEDKNIYVNIVSDSELESKGILSTSFPDTENIDLRLIANETTISPFINNSAIMQISTKEDPNLTEPMKIPIKIFANISFPPTITNRGGDTYYNNKSISFVEVSNLTLTILPPYTINEQLENLSKSIQPIGELWGVFTTIGMGISGFIVFLYKRRKNKQEKHKRL